MINDQIVARLYVFIRENIKGGCKKFSLGDKCECPLCDLDRLLEASNQNIAMNHSELIARLHGLTGTLKSGAWSTIAEAADALQAMERVPMTWQSIDTAPKDGTNVLLYFSGLGWVRGSWDSQIHHRKPKPYWTHDCIQYMGVAHARANQPNWWKPLPPTPPESKG